MMPQQYKVPRSQFADLRGTSRYPCRHAGQCVSSILLDPIYVRSIRSRALGSRWSRVCYDLYACDIVAYEESYLQVYPSQ